MALITLAELKEMVKITDTSQDTLLTNIVARVNEFINSYLNRRLEETTYYEVYSSVAGKILLLDHVPITTILALSLDIDNEAQTYGDFYTEDEVMMVPGAGIIEIPGITFADGYRNIYAEYKAGYADVNMPKDLKMIALEIGAKKYNDITDNRIGISSKNVMNDTLNFSLVNLPPEHREVIDRYNKPPGILGVTVPQYTGPGD